jgi:hypothetical protein
MLVLQKTLNITRNKGNNMATLAEIRARKQAEQQAQNKDLPVVERVTETPTETQRVDAAKENIATAPAVVKQEEPQTKKPLTFPEKMALKKQSLGSTQVPADTSASATAVSQNSPSAATDVVVNTPSITDGVIGAAVAQEKQSVLQKVAGLVAPSLIAEVAKEDLEREEYLNESEDVRAAYRDIKGRINALAALSVEQSELAMSELKKALLQNPSACLLLYDEDLGTLASTLRKLVHEDMVASIKVPKEKKEKGVKTAALQIPLTADMLATKFADL